MLRIATLFIALTILITNAMHAQVEVRGVCGTTDHEYLLNRVTMHQEQLAQQPLALRASIDKYVPVTFIYVGDDNGNGYAREEQALDALAKLNDEYADQEMTYYLKQWKYMPNSDANTMPSSPNSIFSMKLIRDNSSLNVFVCQNINGSGGTPGTVLGRYDSVNDWVLIRKDELNRNSGTLAHEMGHFFGLPHPHSGWECEPWDEDTHGNPVNSVWSPCNGALRVEFQDGSNCTVSGDRICDTPPDYNFGFGWSVGGDGCAPFNIEVMDPQGDVVTPMQENIMGYFIDCPDYAFSDGQKSIIQSDYFSSRRSYLRNGGTPETTPVDGNIALNFPVGGEESPSFNNIEFDWDDAPGANQYLFIIDRFQTFTSPLTERHIVTESSIVLDELSAERTYYWAVWPFNESQTGAGWTPVESFVVGTSTSVNQIETVEEFTVFPNPVSDDHVTVILRSSKNMTANIRLVNLSGQIVSQTFGELIPAGNTWTKEVPVSGLASGLYLVQVVSEDGVATAKLSIQ